MLKVMVLIMIFTNNIFNYVIIIHSVKYLSVFQKNINLHITAHECDIIEFLMEFFTHFRKSLIVGIFQI